MSTRALWSLLAVIGLFCFVGAAVAQDMASEPWLHVQISSDGHDDHDDGDDGDSDGRHDDGDDGRGDGRHDDDNGDHDGDEGADFAANINLPLSAVEPLLGLVPHGALSDRRLDLAGDEVNVGAFRDLWRAVPGVGEVEFVAVDGKDETVRIARTGDQINVQVKECDEDGETVDIRIPVAVVDALFVRRRRDPQRTRGGRAARRAAGRYRPRERGEHQVRVRIDEVAQPGN